MLAATANDLGVSEDSGIMAKILERTQTMAQVRCSDHLISVATLTHRHCLQTAVQDITEGSGSEEEKRELERAAAALTIQKDYRGYRTRQALAQQTADANVAQTADEDLIDQRARDLLELMKTAASPTGEAEDDKDAEESEEEYDEEVQPTMRECAAASHHHPHYCVLRATVC